MEWAKIIARWLFGDYALYRIFALDLTGPIQQPACVAELRDITQSDALAQSDSEEMRKLAAYHQPEAYCYGAYIDGKLASACWVWYGETYRTKRNFWPLQAGEAKLVQIVTDPAYRGKGLAPALIQFAGQCLKELGFQRLYARIWHNNTPSLRAFAKVGWHEIAFVAEIFPFKRKKPLRLVKTKSV